MIERTRISLALLAGFVFLGASAPVWSASEGAIPERLQEEATRPMRWIIESAKLDRRKASGEGRAKAVERTARSAPADAARLIAEDRLPVMRPMPVSRVAERERESESKPAWAPAPAPAALPVAMTGHEAERPISYKPAGELVAKLNLPPSVSPVIPEKARVVPDEPIALVPIAQAPPSVWRGFCGADCEKYFYRVSFKVKPDGKVDVDSIRLIESNYPKLKRAVLDAVATWRYMPMKASLEEEVVLKISAR